MKQGSGRHPPPRGKPGAWLTNEAAEKMLGLAPKWPRRKRKLILDDEGEGAAP